jgi:hypothetical protein
MVQMSQNDTATEEDVTPTARALVPQAVAGQSWPMMPRTSAVFLAHLIATREQAPQTRERRRAEPADALLHYRHGDDAACSSGRLLTRSV